MRAILTLLGLALLAGGCDRQKAAAPQGEAPGGNQAATAAPKAKGGGLLDRSRAGKAPAAIAFQDPDGEAATLAQFKGKPVLLNLWATWCAPCVKEMPTLDALAGREDGKLAVIAVSQDTGNLEKVDAFFSQRGLKSLEPYRDPEINLMVGLGVETLPTTIMFDASGKEVWRFTGEKDWAGPDAAKLIAEAS